MSFSVIFIAISVFAVSQATAIGDLKNGNRQSDIQVTGPTDLENSSLKSMEESLRAAHMKLQANQIEGSAIRDDKQSNQPQIQSQFYSQNLKATGFTLNRDNRDQSLYQSQDNSRDQSLYQSRDNIRDQSSFLSQDSTRDQSLFQSQRDSFPTTTPISSVPSKNEAIHGDLSYQQQMDQESRRNSENQHIYNSNLQSLNQQQFHNDKQQASDEQQFYNSRQQSPVQQQLYNSRQQTPTQQQLFPVRQHTPTQQQLFPVRQHTPTQQQFYNVIHQAVSHQQQIYNPRDQSKVQQQQPFNAGQVSHEQQKIYSNVQTMDINDQRNNLNDQRINLNDQRISFNDQRINLNHKFQGVAVHQSQIRGERPLILSQDAITQIQSKGVSKDAQLSAFDNREHGLVLPRGTSVRSASVIVSGLKNLPMLPAMVYNGGPVPATHAIAYGRDGYYKGSASLSQQLHTPYVRYVYSHIL